ncbi:hypothetical protein FGO68_gene1762 [Halteria grandinella]|uniref:Uncharacterized protein n=1 Tax=Halteria grandinella TaxID=5974 RepID=A0A8J8P8S0_HALGN|nr:hypothetical protein FGO68_gene1762 [Halteria grandinella]
MARLLCKAVSSVHVPVIVSLSVIVKLQPGLQLMQPSSPEKSLVQHLSLASSQWQQHFGTFRLYDQIKQLYYSPEIVTTASYAVSVTLTSQVQKPSGHCLMQALRVDSNTQPCSHSTQHCWDLLAMTHVVYMRQQAIVGTIVVRSTMFWFTLTDTLKFGYSGLATASHAQWGRTAIEAASVRGTSLVTLFSCMSDLRQPCVQFPYRQSSPRYSHLINTGLFTMFRSYSLQSNMHEGKLQFVKLVFVVYFLYWTGQIQSPSSQIAQDMMFVRDEVSAFYF